MLPVHSGSARRPFLIWRAYGPTVYSAPARVAAIDDSAGGLAETTQVASTNWLFRVYAVFSALGLAGPARPRMAICATRRGPPVAPLAAMEVLV